MVSNEVIQGLQVVTVEVKVVLCEVRSGAQEVPSIDHSTQHSLTKRQGFDI